MEDPVRITLVAYEHPPGQFSRECLICQELVRVELTTFGVIRRCPHFVGLDRQFETVNFMFVDRGKEQECSGSR